MIERSGFFNDGPHAGQSMFRATLVREVSGIFEHGGTKTLCICGQNPSRAEADNPLINDPTIHREIGFTKRLGFGRLVKVNSSTRRSTDPKEYYRWLKNLTHSELCEHRERSFEIIFREAKAASMFIAAWGNCDGDEWPPELAHRLACLGIDIYVFALTNSGNPKHTLARGAHRIPDDTVPTLWRKGETHA